jgi:WS/DGAT C-terminal domain
MTRISPMDLSFLLLHNASRPLHMAAFTMFQKPKGQQSTFGPGFGTIPSANLVISNMKGPTEQLYLAGAPLVAFHGLPILPPGAGLNVTYASVNKDICLGIGRAARRPHQPA